MRLFMMLALSAALGSAHAQTATPQPPEQQVRFEAMLADLRARSQAAPNDAARVTLREERARRTQAEGFAAARDWLGTVTRVSVDDRGHATVVLGLSRGIGNILTDGEARGTRAGVRIQPGTALFTQVSQLRQGQQVRFDASFLCYGRPPNFRDCPADIHPSPKGALETPLLLANITRIVPAVPAAVARPAPTVSVWGRSSVAFMESFNAASSAAGMRLEINSLSCRLGPRLECDADVSGLRLVLAGQAEPEAVREVRVGFQGSTPASIVAAASHLVMQVVEPEAPVDERNSAVMAVAGVGGANPSDRVRVRQTQVQFREGWRRGEIVFQPVP